MDKQQLLSLIDEVGDSQARRTKWIGAVMLLPPFTPLGIFVLPYLVYRVRRNTRRLKEWIEQEARHVVWVYLTLVVVNHSRIDEVHVCSWQSGKAFKAKLPIETQDWAASDVYNATVALFPWAEVGESKESKAAFKSGRLAPPSL